MGKLFVIGLRPGEELPRATSMKYFALCRANNCVLSPIWIYATYSWSRAFPISPAASILGWERRPRATWASKRRCDSGALQFQKASRRASARSDEREIYVTELSRAHCEACV